MKFTGKVFLFVLMVIGVSACFDPPQFSNVPVISNPSVYFVEVPNDTPYYGNDTLALVFHFTDGDGDDGLDPEAIADNSGIYTNHFYVSRAGLFLDPGTEQIHSRFVTRFLADGNTVKDTLITYSDRRKGAPYDTLPEFGCGPYDIIVPSDTSIKFDTLYQVINRNNNNIFVKLLVQDPVSLQYEYFDLATGFGGCNPAGLDSRYPILFNANNRSGPLEGDINYGMALPGWLTFFGTSRLKFEVTIQDRALNRSNTISTEPFLIDDIRK